jgi:hypothetical protein
VRSGKGVIINDHSCYPGDRFRIPAIAADFTAASDDCPPAPLGPKEQSVYSESRQYLFCVTPAPYRPEVNGQCLGELYAAATETPTLVWSRYLINNKAPAQVYVTNSGRYIVTMNEWVHAHMLPVVIYGDGGRLTAVHNLESLGWEDVPAQRRVERGRRPWNDGALVFFDPEEETLFVRLEWGKFLITRLKDGCLLDERYFSPRADGERQMRVLQEYADRRTKELALQMLSSPKPNDRYHAALVAKDYRMAEAEPLLRELLNDPTLLRSVAFDRVPMTECYVVREAAQTALDAIQVTQTTTTASTTQPVR